MTIHSLVFLLKYNQNSHCRNFAPEYEKAARAAKGVFKIGAVEADKEKELSAKYNIQGFPTVKFFGANKNSPTDYNGGRTAQAVVDFMFEKAKKITNSRLGGSSSGSSQKSSSSSGSKDQKPGNEKDVIVLDDNTFDKTVYGDEQGMWVVAFYAPWCKFFLN